MAGGRIGAKHSEQFLRTMLRSTRQMSVARRFFTAFPVGWRILHRLTYLVLQQVSHEEAYPLLAQASRHAFTTVNNYHSYYPNSDVRQILWMFYRYLLEPLLDTLDVHQMRSLIAPKDPWQGADEPADMSDPVVVFFANRAADGSLPPVEGDD